MTPETVIGWGLHLAVELDCLWPELVTEPLLPTIAAGIPATLDECVAFRWVHPVEDRRGW